jgi:hypothetical protein
MVEQDKKPERVSIFLESSYEALELLKQKLRNRDPEMVAMVKELKLIEFDGIKLDAEGNIIS